MKYILCVIGIAVSIYMLYINLEEEQEELISIDNIQGELIDSEPVKVIHTKKPGPEEMNSTTDTTENITVNTTEENTTENVNATTENITASITEESTTENVNTTTENITASTTEENTIENVSTTNENIIANTTEENTTENVSTTNENIIANTTEENTTENVSINNTPNVVENINLETDKHITERTNEKKSLPKKEGKERTPEKEYEPMSFQFLSSFDINENLDADEIKKIPDYIRTLEGKTIGIPGFMVPTDMTQTNISKFLLVNMNDSCCFGGTPKITEFVFAETEEDVKYTNFPIAIIGIFSINNNFEEKILYKIKVEKVVSARDSMFWDIMKNAPKFPQTKENSFSYGNSFYNQDQ